jgi:glutaredoxin 3
VSRDPDERQRMTALSGGRRTVPQIFVDGASIGGCNELYSLERQGKLDEMLASA